MLYLSVTAHAYWIHDILLGNPVLKWFGFKPKQHIMDTTEAGQDMIEQWGSSLHKTKITHLKEQDFVQNAASTITAGSDTSAAALHAFVYYTVRHPLIHASVVAELDAAHAAGRLSTTIQASEALSLPYLQAVLKECLRVFPPVPSGLPRRIPDEGLFIGGRYFPAGTTLSVNPHAIHRSPECFGRTANNFVPERWLGEEGKALEKYFVPFGQGYNSCPGRSIAFILLRTAAAMLVREFEFREVEGKPWKYENRFTVVPHSWPCYVRKRDWRAESVVKGE